MSDAVAGGIVEADTLRTYLKTINGLVAEARIHIGDHGFRVSAVDPGNVAMWQDVTLSPQAFEHFDSPGTAVVGVNLVKLLERFDTADGSDLIEFDLDMESRMLEVSYRTVTQRVALIDQQAIRDEPDDPDLDVPNTVVAEGRQFSEMVDVADALSDHVAIEARPDDREVGFVVEGDVDTAEVVWTDEDVIDADVTGEGHETILSVEYLQELFAELPADAEVTLHFGDEHPIRVKWDACEGYMNVHGMLAPRIQNR